MIITLVGPIGHWWDENWDTPERWEYAAHRDAVSEFLVGRGHLVYRPHEAFKGRWSRAAQRVNDAALVTSDIVMDLSPPGVPSPGTDEERALCRLKHIPVVSCPPGADLAERLHWAERRACSCHWVDIGVGETRGAEDPTCVVHHPLAWEAEFVDPKAGAPQ